MALHHLLPSPLRGGVEGGGPQALCPRRPHPALSRKREREKSDHAAALLGWPIEAKVLPSSASFFSSGAGSSDGSLVALA